MSPEDVHSTKLVGKLYFIVFGKIMEDKTVPKEKLSQREDFVHKNFAHNSTLMRKCCYWMSETKYLHDVWSPP